MQVPYNYLDRQFADIDAYLEDIRELVKTGDFTIGKPLYDFEKRFASVCKMPFAIGMSSGTDALIQSLRVCDIGPGDEVITTPTTFIATVSAIAVIGARPVFVDSEDGYVIDPEKIEEKITAKTKAILPVHYTGNMADMPAIMEIAKKHGLHVIEDACHALTGSIDGKLAGSWGDAGAFSLHPLKHINVWGDGGVVVTRSEEMDHKLRLNRNYGLLNRDEALTFGYNCRLDTLQAVVASRLIEEIESIVNNRIENARTYDEAFSDMQEFIRVPIRRPGVKHIFQTYVIRVERRDELLSFLKQNGIEVTVHYPIPLHLQKASEYLGYKKGDFPVCELDSETIITLPCHQHLTRDEIAIAIGKIRSFYLS
jgi:dTDP-3-amino-2,3,6-trideoxy-4-keto-D-glucose/dTDP-3-amino-3,4,6-trideoxy-alpha-D-glucose/dTDP-2,6-dideoxy-D-kanosamine transaminase